MVNPPAKRPPGAARTRARHPGRATPSKSFDFRDAQQTVILAAMTGIALLPERWQLPACRQVARFTARRSWYSHKTAERLPLVLIRTFAHTRLEALQHYEALSLLERVHVMRSYLPGGWHPRITLEGETHLREACACGRGAVLWVSGFSHSTLVAKMALHQHGYEVSHLSRPSHGFSNTRFGRRYLNPIRQHLELRYLKERIVMYQDPDIRAMRRLRERLRENGLVSITVDHDALKTVDVPFLEGSIRLPTGPSSLARNAGAALLPVFTLADGDGFRVVIGAPVEVGRRGSAAAYQDGLREFARVLERYVWLQPERWMSWINRIYRTEPDSAAAPG